MPLNLNPWLALLLGLLIGWLLEWLLELWFFRRRRLECQRRLKQAEADLAAREAELRNARAHAETLEREVTLRATATPPSIKVEAPGVDLLSAGLGLAAGRLTGEAPPMRVEAPRVEVEAPAGALPKVEAELPHIEVEAPKIDLPSAGLGLAAGAVAGRLSGEASSVEIETPTVKAELPHIEVEAPTVALPKVEAELPHIEVAAPAVSLPKAELPHLEAPKIDLPSAGLGLAAGAVAGRLGGEASSVEIERPAVKAELPRVDLEAPTVTLPKVEAELPHIGVEAPTVTLPKVEAELPHIAVEAPAVSLPKAELPHLEAPKIDLPSAGLGLAAGAVAGRLGGETPSVEIETPAVEAELPALEVEAPHVEVEAPTADVEWQTLAGAVDGVTIEGPRAHVTPPVVGAEVPGVTVGLPGVAVEAVQPGAGWAADDLAAIKGIGPKYAAQLSAAGITSFAALAAADPQRLRQIINAPKWRQVDYAEWVAEAKSLAQAPKRANIAGDDLLRIEGIGSVYAGKLREAGITTFAQLAEADETALAGIIRAPEWRRVSYGDWRTQARLLADGDEAGLAALQARLFARTGDNLGLVSGIGEKAAGALSAAGIASFAALAAATPEQLSAITHAAGVRGGDFVAWIEEAKLRAAGKRVVRVRRTRNAGRAVACPQDLSRVRGIGRVFEEKLYAAGIGTFWELAQAADEELTRILEIKEFQRVNLAEIKASAQALAEETDTVGRQWDGTPPDDFELLEGIGEVYEGRLYDAGICTYRALAAVTVEQLAAICNAPAWRMPDYANWIAQAARLAEGK
jgi:predicted flap endonuclease-1-like 5' DNA nuclease